MPRNVRNFWLQARIDGRASTITGGPTRKDGGFSLTIDQRDDGGIVRAIEILGVARVDGSLGLYVRNLQAEDPYASEIRIETKR